MAEKTYKLTIPLAVPGPVLTQVINLILAARMKRERQRIKDAVSNCGQLNVPIGLKDELTALLDPYKQKRPRDGSPKGDRG